MRKNLRDVFTNQFWMVAPHLGFGDSRKDGLMYQENGFRIGSIKEDQQYPRNIIAMLVALGNVPSSLRRAGCELGEGRRRGGQGYGRIPRRRGIHDV